MDQVDPKPDPVYVHTLHEAKIILCLWTICLVYTCTYCYLYGYLDHPTETGSTGPSLGALVGDLPQFDRDPSTLTMPLGLGIPDWVFYGIVVPWCVCIVVTLVFCGFVFQEDNLGVERDPSKGGSSGENEDRPDA